MKIAHLATGHSAFDTRIFHKQCKSLAAVGYNVNFVVPHDKDVLIDGVQIKAIRIPKSRFNRMGASAWRAYMAAIELDADIYHLHDPNLIPVGLALKRHNKIVIFDSHEDYPVDMLSKTWIPFGIRKYISIIYTYSEKYAFAKFDAVITTTEEVYERIAKFQSKTFVVKNLPIKDMSFHVVEQRIPKFVWLGTFGPNRGASQIDAALKMRNNASMDVIGIVVDFKPCSDSMKFLGYFPLKEAMLMASKYLAGLVTFLPEPQFINCLPIKLFEYMMMGLPVIASDFPKWRSIIEDAGCGILVNPNSPQEIAQAMQWMLDNQLEAFEMGMRGRDAVIQKYSWLSEEKILLKIYKGFIK